MILPIDGTQTGRLLAALTALATALFVLSGQVPVRWARGVRVAAVAVYGALFIGAAVYAVLWLLGVGL